MSRRRQQNQRPAPKGWRPKPGDVVLYTNDTNATAIVADPAYPYRNDRVAFAAWTGDPDNYVFGWITDKDGSIELADLRPHPDPDHVLAQLAKWQLLGQPKRGS